jgi:hypothetical protein
MKELKTFSDRLEADMLCAILNDNKIYAIIKADDCAGLRPHLAFATGGYTVCVDEKDYKRALELMESVIGSEKESEK